MGNANAGHHRPESSSGEPSNSASRNPLQRGHDIAAPAHNSNATTTNNNNNGSSSGQRAQKLQGVHGERHSSVDDDDRACFVAGASLPQPPHSALQSVHVGNGGEASRGRRVSVAIKSEEDPPHQPPQRLAGFRRLSNVDSLDSNEESVASHASSLNGRPRLTLAEAREILLSIFFPRQGQLECIASGFLTREHYTLLRGFWAPFLTTDLRDKWYLDAVMLSVLGKDRWRSSRQQKEIIMSVAPSREQVLQLNQQRQEYTDQLRERLLDLCGSLVESPEHQAKRTNLQALLEDYHRHKETSSACGGPSSSTGGGGGGVEGERGLRRTTSEATSSMQHQELLSLSLMRLQTTVSTSFDCFELLASRIPTSVISSLPSKYFLNSTPVVYDAIAFQEKKVGDMDNMSFFMSIESRRRLLNGQAPNDAERMLNSSLNELGFAHSINAYDGAGPEGFLSSARQLYAAVRHAGLVVTTACSSMVLTVMFQLADVLRARQIFRDNRAKAAQKGITLEQLVGRKEAAIRTYSGKPIDDVEELKRYAITDEMSLSVLTRLLIARFRKENWVKMEKLRKRFPNLFAYLEAIAPPEEQDDFDVPRLLSGMVLKLMFLTGGGQRSIAADDRRVPAGIHQMTDDVAISNMLEVPILNRICWVACMMGMPIMSNHGMLAQKHQGKPLTYIELDECCGVMRMLFQAVGALPCGNACPHAFKEWFPLFPFYAVNAEGKRVLTYLYMAQVSAIQRVPLTIQKDMTLLSFATALQASKGQGRVDIANYFFEPTLTVGFTGQDRDGEFNSMSCTVAAAASPYSVAAATGPASPLAPKSIAGTLSTNARADRASPLSTSVNGSSAAKVMPASLSPSAVKQQQFQYMNAVNVSTPTGTTGSKASPSTSGRHTGNGGGGAGSPHHHNNNNGNAQGRQKSLLDEPLSSASSSSASLSCSTLLDDDRDIDVYTCVNPQTQLYMRCSNEATLRRHRATELTPSVTATFLHSSHETQSKRPDLAPALHQAVPKLMPSEGFLVVKWTSAEPLVTFCAGDIISVMAERVTSSSSHASNANLGTLQSPGSAQARSGSARYFTGAVRPSVDGTMAGPESSESNKALNLEDSATRMPATSPRVHTVTIDDALQPGNSSRAGLSLSDRLGGGTSSNAKANVLDGPFMGYCPEDDLTSSSSGSYTAPEKTRLYQGLMHEFLGVKEKVSRRLAVRWNVVDVLPSSQLVHRTRRLSAVANSSGTSSTSSKHQEQYRNEVVLHVAAPEMPVSFPLRVLTIGHERAAMSVFTFVSPDSDSVCWANPRLMEAIVNRSGSASPPSGSPSAFVSVNGQYSQASGSTGKGPSGILCNTEEELHNVFFSIGVLLSNAIVNGVYLSIPLAPLAFFIMKKALNSGDYSFKSFMWLEPADGNLLSPALLLNSAYEILTMSEPQYVAFLHARGVTGGEANIFPVVHSLADEMREDRAWQNASSARAQEESSRRSQSQTSGGRQQQQQVLLHTQGSGDSALTATTTSAARERSLNVSQAPSSMHDYLKLIEVHNRGGSTFRRSQAYTTGASSAGMPHNFIMSTSVPVSDRLHGYRTQQGKADGPTNSPDASATESLYAKLPSRREYLFLYLVNDLAWGSVRRDGIGEKNKGLGVSMARGFMTSAAAKSPLMTSCCSRIVCEVLCVPRPDS